jgi:Collagen triple helix repeat (20 copies)
MALVLAMSGGALAASRYLIDSTKQISPKVLKQLRGARGETGASGSAGASGVEGKVGAEGKPGTEGKPGATGKEGPEGREGKRGVKGEEGPQGKEGPEGQQGPEGPEGGVSGEPAALLHWRKTINTAGASVASANTVVLAEAVPFTITGHCYENGEQTVAQTYISSTQSSSYLRIYEEPEYQPLGAAQVLVPEDAKGLTTGHETDFEGGPEGSFSAMAHDGKTALDGAADQGVWLRGPTGPACSFSGYSVRD